MATTRVGIYRSYHGAIPVDDAGQPLPKSEWPKKRLHSWVVRWFGVDRSRFSKSFDSRKEAERFKEAKQNEVRRGDGDPPKKCTLRDFADEHRKLSKGSAGRKTLLGQMSVMKELAKCVGWDRDMRKIASIDIERFRSWRTDCDTVSSPATVKTNVNTLKGLFNRAIGRGYLPEGRNPCKGVALEKVGEKRPPFLAPEKFELVFAQAQTLIARVQLVIFYTTAVRREEGFHLTWDDLDFERMIVHVARHDADGYIQAWKPKDHERREIPLTIQAIELLKELKQQAPPGCPYILMDAARWEYFRGCVDRGEWSEKRHLINNPLRKFKTLLKRAGVGKFTLHDLRRSCITNWARQGVPIHVAQKLAGHADIATTQKFYLSVQDDDLKAARRAQQKIVKNIPNIARTVALKPTDQKVTKSAQKRDFPERRQFADGTQLPDDKAVA